MAKAKKEEMVVGEASAIVSQIVNIDGEDKIEVVVDGEVRHFGL